MNNKENIKDKYNRLCKDLQTNYNQIKVIDDTQTQTQTTKQVIVIADRVTFLSANTQNTINMGEGEI